MGGVRKIFGEKVLFYQDSNTTHLFVSGRSIIIDEA